MRTSRKKWGFVIVGAVAAVALGAIAVAGAATSQSASPAPSAAGSASAQGQHAPDFDGDGPHGGLGGDGGGVRAGGLDLAEALAKLSGKDASVIMQQHEAGKTFKQIADAYGVDTTKLVADAVAIETAELDAAVTAGTLTDAQRSQELSGLQARFQQELTETATMGHGGPGDGRGHGFGGGDVPEALAKLSGKDASVIIQQRAGGKSFAQIAKSYGVSTDELLAETVKIEKAELDAAVKAGQMTAAERTRLLSGLQARLKTELTETQAFGDGGHGFGYDGDGPQGSTGSTQSGGGTGAGHQTAPSTSGTTQTF
jgi:hypothetical protein